MMSVPPRGSGWVSSLSIVNCRFSNWREAIRLTSNGKSKIRRPTGYRLVVLTSSNY
jgi:hypothetical protein